MITSLLDTFKPPRFYAEELYEACGRCKITAMEAAFEIAREDRVIPAQYWADVAFEIACAETE